MLTRMHRLALTLMATAFLFSSPVLADQPILTITGKIEKQNRGPFDPFSDALFQTLDVQFDSAYQFTYDELKALPQTSLSVRYENWPNEVSVSGPLLTDVLAVVEPSGETVTVRAIDGYAPEFSVSEIKAGQFVLALDAEGAPLSVGGRGPVWLVFPPDTLDGQPATDDHLTWAAFHIEVR